MSDDPMPVRKRRKIRPLDEEEKKYSRVLAWHMGDTGMYPLNAPGMPPPGPDFLHAARATGDTTVFVKETKTRKGEYTPGAILEELYRRALREPGFNLSVEVKKGKPRVEVTFVPGHVWGQWSDEWQKSDVTPRYVAPPVTGPQPAEVLVLGKMPWREETHEKRNLVGASGEILRGLAERLHVKNPHLWYVTNLVKFMPPEEHGSTTLKAPWVHDCLPLLYQELMIVRPRYVLCLGADASKWLLGDKFNVTYMAGRVVPLVIDLRLHADDQPDNHTAHVMTVLHPAEVSRSPEKGRILESNFGRFAHLLEGHNLDLEESGLDHRVIDTLEDAREWAQEVNAYMAGRPQRDRLVAWDAEWQGQHPCNAGTYVRTIQLAWGHKKAVCFKMTHQGGQVAFRDRAGRPAARPLARLLNEFMADKRAVGHFLVSDLEWLQAMGVDPTVGSPVPVFGAGGRQAWQLLRAGQGWLDTAMMNHAIEETAPLGLEWLTMRYTMAPRYDVALEDAIKLYCKERGIKREALEGYGELPDKVLIPYALYDADVTLRACRSLLPLLDSDYEGNCCWEPFWESMVIQKPILRIHRNGILVDRQRVDDLTGKFMTARAMQEEQIRTWARWPEFNIRSVQQVREFLFGEKLNGKVDKTGQTVRIRPPDGATLHVRPLLDTSKPPRRWKDLVVRGQARDATPGTGKMVLGILAQENLNVSQQIGWIRDYRFLDQVLKSVLRPPRANDQADAEQADSPYIINDDGFYEYDAGLAGSLDDDGRVRTHLYPTAETGRWRSARPNLQNISKARDPDYVRMLGADRYKHKLRSILRASPGYALMEFDYKTAELLGMALMAGSKKMQEHCNRAVTYDEEGYDIRGKKAEKGHPCPGDCKKCRKQGANPAAHACTGACSLCGYPHPDYHDIHSHVAIMAFQLDCHPSKFGLELIGKTHFRTLAKNVIFGIAYGRGAKAIALQAKEQGVNATPEQAQLVIDAIFDMYPELLPFFERARERATVDRWLCHCFGRFRRFPSASDYVMEGEFERQAMNFPIQGMIASAVDRGLAYLDHEIDRQGLTDDIRLLLQMHDAGLVEVKYHMVGYARQLITWAMCDMVEIWPTDLAGVPRGDGPYHLGLDFSVEHHWGEKYSKEEMQELGIV